MSAEERAPGGVQSAGSRPGCLARMVRLTVAALTWWPRREFAVHPAVSPGGVFPCEPQHQVLDFLAGLRTWVRLSRGPGWPAGSQIFRQARSRRRQQPQVWWWQRVRQEPHLWVPKTCATWADARGTPSARSRGQCLEGGLVRAGVR